MIVRAGINNVAAIQKILWETWLATYAEIIPKTDLEVYFGAHYSAMELSALLLKDEVVAYLAHVQDQAAGTMITRDDREAQRLYVSSLYVLPGFQGHGIGTRLLEMAETVAASAGRDHLWLGVMVQNVRSVHWYERIGFRFEEHLPFMMGQTTVEHLIGSRRIRPSA